MDQNIGKVIPEYIQPTYFPIYRKRQEKNGTIKNVFNANALLKITQMLNIRILNNGMGVIIKKGRVKSSPESQKTHTDENRNGLQLIPDGTHVCNF